MTNPYAPPQATVLDVADPYAPAALAERGTRLVATVLDGIIVATAVYLPMIIGLAVGGALDSQGDSSGTIALALGAGVGCIGFIVWSYFTIVNVTSNGQSIAKKMMGIKVVRSDGSPASLGRIFLLRNVVNTLIGLIPVYGFIDALFIFGEPRQCLHDKIADTLVIKA